MDSVGDGHFYLSFASEAGFLGATVVAAVSKGDALMEANRLGLNPGGEAAILAVPWRLMTEDERAEMLSYKNRLVGKAELLANGGGRAADMAPQARLRFESEVTIVCEDCNAPAQAIGRK